MSIAEVVTTGLLLVFGLLVLITGILYLLPLILRGLGLGGKHKEPKAPKQVEQPAPKVVVQEKASSDESQIIAVIMAAISAYEESLGNPSGNFRVVSFKRIGRKRA